MSGHPAATESGATPASFQAEPKGRRRGTAGAPGTADPEAIAPAVEAILLTSERPVGAGRLAESLGLAPPRDEEAGPRSAPAPGSETGTATIKRAIELLNEQYTKTGRSFRVEQVAGGYRLMTLPKFAEAVAAFQGVRAKSALTHAALESLAIIAYKQPITRAQLEAIRGVACGDILRSLVDRRLVTIAGRAEELGRPILYATTRLFLETFGLTGLKDLPSIEELRARAAGEPAA